MEKGCAEIPSLRTLMKIKLNTYMSELEKPNNTLAICALVFAFLCSLVGLILGIIGLNKYPDRSNGKTMSLIAVIISIIVMLVGGFTAWRN